MTIRVELIWMKQLIISKPNFRIFKNVKKLKLELKRNHLKVVFENNDQTRDIKLSLLTRQDRVQSVL